MGKRLVCGCGGLCDSGHPCPMGKYVDDGEPGPLVCRPPTREEQEQLAADFPEYVRAVED